MKNIVQKEGQYFSFLSIVPLSDRRFCQHLHRLPDRLKCLIQILNDIINMLCTDGQTDGIWTDALICQFFLI